MRKGQSHSPETKAKISASKVGITFTPEHSQAISNSLRGKKKSLAHRKAISLGIQNSRLAKVNKTKLEETIVKENNPVL